MDPEQHGLTAEAQLTILLTTRKKSKVTNHQVVTLQSYTQADPHVTIQVTLLT